MTNDNVTHAQSLIEQGAYDQSVHLLKQIVADPKCANDAKADALQMLGAMTQVDPTAVGDDCALPYYKRALELCPNHLWALHGIVATFGDHFPDHQDVAAVKHALEQLKPRLDELGRSGAEVVRSKEQLFERHTGIHDA